MPNGTLEAIRICPTARGPMVERQEVLAIAGAGLEGDRYTSGEGSYNKKTGIGNRQVTLMNARFFEGSRFTFSGSRRNLFTRRVELMWLIGREFSIGESVRMYGVKYCDPCKVPSAMSGLSKRKGYKDFDDEFEDCGGLIAEILEGGIIKVGDEVIPPPKGY